MISLNQANPPQILNNHISVHAATVYCGYSLQYLRRLLRNGKVSGLKIGQLWLVDKGALDMYLQKAQTSTDQRFGPK